MIRDIYNAICQQKEFVVKLNGNELREYKELIYKLPIKEWQINLLWEYIWSDISKDEIERIFKERYLI